MTTTCSLTFAPFSLSSGRGVSSKTNFFFGSFAVGFAVAVAVGVAVGVAAGALGRLLLPCLLLREGRQVEAGRGELGLDPLGVLEAQRGRSRDLALAESSLQVAELLSVPAAGVAPARLEGNRRQPFTKSRQALRGDRERDGDAPVPTGADAAVGLGLRSGELRNGPVELDLLARGHGVPADLERLGRYAGHVERRREMGRVRDRGREAQVGPGKAECPERAGHVRRAVAELRVDVHLGELALVRQAGVDVQGAFGDHGQAEVLEHRADVRVLDLHGEVGAVEGVQAAQSALDVEPELLDPGLERHADVPPREERVERPQLSRQRGRVPADPALGGDRQEVGRAGRDRERLEERDAVRLAGRAIGDAHIAEIAFADDGRDLGHARVERVRTALLLPRASSRRRGPSSPCRPCPSRAERTRRRARASGRRPAPRRATTRPISVAKRPTSTICGAEPHPALPRRTRSALTETDGSTWSAKAPSIAKGRPVFFVTKASMRPLCRLRSPKAM